ncbi:hypothetical protein A7Q10_08940 [Methylacidiphilum caldifontis]|uniref:Uncharacterized protein n=1 Tax=Methylacidiphilum caldifontis TaxID=2795386 RepID=A0A4Y8PB21_9BACT|nr:hypothetical protein A7Q10_08940 [Methylacidiphilum caldifontis]
MKFSFRRAPSGRQTKITFRLERLILFLDLKPPSPAGKSIFTKRPWRGVGDCKKHGCSFQGTAIVFKKRRKPCAIG